MGRNNICFCGSGLKQKKCHPDINEESRAAKVIKLHKKIDIAIENHYKNTNFTPVCYDGCSECCYDYFVISDIEFAIILYELRKWSQLEIEELRQNVKMQWEFLNINFPELVDNLEKYATNKNDVFEKDFMLRVQKTGLPCPFLDAKSNNCKIYNVRPSVCRSFGTGFIDKDSYQNNIICSKIGNSIEAKVWQTDISNFENDLLSLTNLYCEKYDLSVSRRAYPIVYELYLSLIKYKSDIEIPKMYEKFSLKEKEYIRRIMEENKIL